MTRFSVEILPQAEAEIREAFLWYFERSPLAVVLAVARQRRKPGYWRDR